MHDVDPLALSQALIRCPSITPIDAGALDVLTEVLESLGFVCHRLAFSSPGSPEVQNLYARWGTGSPNLCFAGHTDVVPVGAESDWSVDPFAAEIRNDRLYGRGASDMKAAIACFVAASDPIVRSRRINGSISLLITGDEEGSAVNGTVRVLDWLRAKREHIHACVVGEPTNPVSLGEMIKVGRRGSLTARITVQGRQGHAAYPHRADNPIPRLIRWLGVMDAEKLDEGSDAFEPSTFTITSVDVGNPATNVIPARARATLNIRFNDCHTAEELCRWIENHGRRVGAQFDISYESTGEAFLCPPSPLSTMLADAVTAVTGRHPEFSTSGGTSDARFIKNICPVLEFGMVGETAHKVDENVLVTDIANLTKIYSHLLHAYFGKTS